jgi:hypothetical protein
MAALPDRARPRAQKCDFESGSRQFIPSATIGRLFIPVTIRSGGDDRTLPRPAKAALSGCFVNARGCRLSNPPCI